MYLIFDTETTGLPKDKDAPISASDNWPRCVQIAWQLHDEMGRLLEHDSYLIRPDGYVIPYESETIHGISTELALENGVELVQALEKFHAAVHQADYLVGHNLEFDLKIMAAEYYRLQTDNPLEGKPILDTCSEQSAGVLQIPGGRGGKFKLPTLTELHSFLFGEPFTEAHNATADVEATARCFLEMIRNSYFSEDLNLPDVQNFQKANPSPFAPAGLRHSNLKQLSDAIRARNEALSENSSATPTMDEKTAEAFEQAEFAHLHNHTQFSILQSTISVENLVKAAADLQMPAVAITDHANMMGAFQFVSQVQAYNQGKDTDAQLKAIVGCEFYVCEDRLNKSRKDDGYQVIFLAKNKAGYHNLAKMSSLAYTEGFYYVPRIDREIVEKYKDNLIVLTGNLQGEVPHKILSMGESQAEEALIWWKNVFGPDLYVEVMRHGQEDEDRVNQVLVPMAQKHNVKIIAANNTYYIAKEDAHAHDILLCVKEGKTLATPKGRGRAFRYGLPNDEYYFKSSAEMKNLFKDLPEAILNIQEILDKIEPYSLQREVLLPKFVIPDEFLVPEDQLDGGKRGENDYLRFLTFEGAKKRYGTLTPEIEERLNFELSTIERTGYPGYFLIVQDLIREARRLGVSVGPGRGSAAGSAVAYCLEITNIDPISYDLLFERFLNPDRVSMPDIDIDFDDEGRGKVMDYVIRTYGATQVAQIITYGTMAAKSSIRDTARVLDLPLYEADKIAKLIPNLKLNKIFSLDSSGLRAALRSDELENVRELMAISEGTGIEAETIKQAKILEGSLRNTGTHACGVIITPDDITNFVPIATAKDSDLYVTQFDNAVVERAGLLKMDFLGLKTLTLIKDTVQIVKQRHGITLDPDQFPKDDQKTYELFQKGETIGIFQYESPGMQKYMKELKPTVFGDLIAMNALYRPGPMEYIPRFIRRKHGLEPIVYDLDACEEYLQETYGITVYQEQVMLLSQKLASFSKGEADQLRKAMGKKQKSVLDELKPKFIAQASDNGHDPKILAKIWTDWEAFASYAFNKSHSTCYAWIAYQTAYLKAHYPAEYMAAVLSNNMNDIKQVTFFMEECKRMGVKVLGPDVNESYYKFTVNEENAVRFGMGAVKGVGAGAVETIVENRKDGPYKSIFDLTKRIDLRAANKKALESLAYAGGYDSFPNAHRAQYFHQEDGMSTLEKAIKYGAKHKESENSSQASLFGGAMATQLPEPTLLPCAQWGLIEKLKHEKNVIGIYLTSHPLDTYRFEITHFCKNPVKTLHIIDKINGNDIDETTHREFNQVKNRELVIGGLISAVNHRTTKSGKPFGIFTLEDYGDSYEIALFGENYIKYKAYLTDGYFIMLRCAIQEFRHSKSWGLEVRDMQLLSELRDKMVKSLTIQLPIETLDEQFIDQMKVILAKNAEATVQPSCQLKFQIFDRQDSIHVEMPSKGIRIHPDNAFIQSLEALERISYKLN